MHHSFVDPRSPQRGRRGRRSDPSGDPNTSTWERQVYFTTLVLSITMVTQS
jgi:hypothetical protein